MGIYAEIKEQVTAREVAERYGYRISRNGMMRCPFHDDKTPSMKIDRNFICFGCQEKGDVIRFAEKLFDLKPYDAAQKLIADFGLTVTVPESGNSPPKKKQKQKSKAKRRSEKFQKSVDRIYSTYCDYLHLLNDWRYRYAPETPEDDLHPMFVEALQKTNYVEYLLDGLFYGSPEDKAQIVIEKGKEIDALERRIAEYKFGAAGGTGQNDGCDGRSSSGRAAEAGA